MGGGRKDATQQAGEDRSTGLWRYGGAAIIIVDDATKNIATLYRAHVLRLAVGDGATLVNALMRPRNVVISVGELIQHPLQMSIIEDEKMIETLISGCSHSSFGVSIRIRSPKGRGQNMETLADENGIECIRVLDIVVTDQKPQRVCLIIESPQDLSGLLCDPGTGRVSSDPSQVDATSSDIDEEEHVQGFQPERLHCKEITSQKLVFVMSEEVLPTNGTVPDWRRLDIVSFEDVTNGGLRSLEAQLTKLTLDLAIAPTGILLG